MTKPQPGDLLGKVPPQSKDAEQAVLGAMLLDQTVVPQVLTILTIDDYFYHEAHRKIFSAIRLLFGKSQPADSVTVSEELRKSDDLEAVGGATYIAWLSDDLPPVGNVEHHANIIKEKGLLRSAISSANEVIAGAYDEDADAQEVLAQWSRLLYSLQEKQHTQQLEQIGPTAKKVFDNIMAAFQQKRRVPGLPTGFCALDTLLAGLHNGDMIIISGRQKIGKTSLALNIADHLAVEKKIPVAIFSLEMSKEGLINRLYALRIKADSRDMTAGFITEKEKARLGIARDIFDTAPLYIDDTSGQTILDVAAKARYRWHQGLVKAIIIDYAQLLKADQKYQSETERFTALSYYIKTFARELNVPVICVSRLSAAGDLYGARAWEYDADVVLQLRPSEGAGMAKGQKAADGDSGASEGIDEPVTVQAHVLYQRNGPEGVVPLLFFKSQSRFEDVEHTRQEPDQDDIPF